MKGLILKDMYMMKTYFRISWIVVLIFLVVGALNEKASFYHAYSCMMGGIVPISILSYDEKERWMDYADTLPLSAKTIVRSKYLFGLIFSIAVFVLATVSYAVNCVMHRGGDLSSVEFCHQIGLDYVSCSPFRVPIARLAAAQAALR